MTKNTKFSNFQSFYEFFVIVSTDVVDWIVLKGQQENVGCPLVFYEGIIAIFGMKMSQIVTENNENLKIFVFFPHALSIGTLKRVNKKRICCPVCLEKNKCSFSI